MSTALMTRAAKGQDGRVPPDPEVPERPKRRRFTAEYKLAILKEAEGHSVRALWQLEMVCIAQMGVAAIVQVLSG